MSRTPPADGELRQRRRQLRRAQRLARTDPVGFARDVLGFSAWSKQREILESVRDNEATAVRSCHGVGKTATAAEVALVHLAAWGPEAIVVTTAPTWRQVKDLLWREIRKAVKRAEWLYDCHITETRLEFSEHWYAVGLSTNQPENFQGYHSPRLLLIVDEASGVRQSIFEAAEGFLTAPGARTLLIGNPTQVGGEFYAAFHAQRSLYRTIRISAFDAPAFTGEEVPQQVARVLPSRQWVERMKVKYRVPDEHERGGPGVKLNPVYEVRVLGQFPSQGERAVVSMWLVENAQNRELEPDPENDRWDWPRIVSCDVARFGADETVIAVRRGKSVRIVDVRQGQDTMATAGDLLRVARGELHPLHGRPSIVVDDSGVGGGVVDRLREVGEFNVIQFNAAAAVTADCEDEYPNARSQTWFEFAEDWLPELDLEGDETGNGEQLLADLCAPEYKLDSRGRRVVEPKDETKKRLGRSPDRADAVLMAFSRAANGAVGRVAPIGLAQPGGSKWLSSGRSSGGSRWR